MITRTKKVGIFAGLTAGFIAVVASISMTPAASAAIVEDEELRIEAMAQERATADCMRTRGFQYVVALPNDVLLEEAVAAAVAAGQDADAAAEAVSAQLPVDPNEAPVAALPAAQQDKWYDNLHGTDAITPCSDAYLRGSSQAQAALAADQAIGEAATTAAETSATVKAAEATYVGCMAGLGYTVTNTNQITEIVSAKTDEIIASAPWPADLPDPLPANATAAEKARWAAADARTSKAEADAAAFSDTANTAHEGCVAPYHQAFDEAYNAVVPS